MIIAHKLRNKRIKHTNLFTCFGISLHQQSVILQIIKEINQLKQLLHLTRSSEDLNCLYNLCSLAISGSEDLSHLLRALTSAELFLFSEFYASHPHFVTLLVTSYQKDLMETLFSSSFTFSPNDLLVIGKISLMP